MEERTSKRHNVAQSSSIGDFSEKDKADNNNTNNGKDVALVRSESWPGIKSQPTDCTISKTSLFEFGKLFKVAQIGSEWKQDVDDYKVDTIKVTNFGKRKVEFKFASEPDPRIELDISPREGIIPKGKTVDIFFKLRVFCTTSISHCIEMSISGAKKKPMFPFHKKDEPPTPEHFLLYYKVKSEPSRSLDYEEITIEEKNLASGAFGVVSRGRYRQQDVCIKTVDALHSKEDFQALEQEIFVLEQVHSPFLVTYLGSTRIPGQPVCLVMQWEKAGSLADVMERKDIQLSDRLKCKILLDAARGVQHLHCNEVYHMDIKPGNMVIASLDENAQINTKLIDFDLARISVDDHYRAESKGKHFGSIPYCPPEALNYDPFWRAATYDSYSFGITAWEVLSGKTAYANLDTSQIRALVTSDGRPDIQAVKPEFRSLIERCWHPNRKHRPSFDQIVTELEDILIRLPKTPRDVPVSLGKPSQMRYIPPDEKEHIGWADKPSRKQAEDMLLGKGYPVGTFLFRWSDKAESYVMSYLRLDKKGKESVDHIGYITMGPDGEIVVSGVNHKNTYYPSLTAYVADMKKKGIISRPIPFESVYSKTPHPNNYFNSSSTF